ncbi:MAG TPA: elongation factor P maturation arginine rhamnosyltransferase EarP, partial [Burkholderiaceae bacterium]|nr:elongation factor P maturation arginine rhamnosyltransferase EarP [Burkholderiaceae bacterium]
GEPAARAKDAPLRGLLFCYPYAPWQDWLAQAGAAGRPVALWVPAAGHGLQASSTGAVIVSALPLMDQAQFDARLAELDFAFVRGEDSVVQAIVSGVPFIWNIYAQADGAHEPKLAALLAWWCAGLHRDAAAVVQQVHRAWNSPRWPAPEQGAASLWQRYLDVLPLLAEHARRVAARLRAEPDLGARLASWVGRSEPNG